MHTLGKTIMNTTACGAALQKYSVILYCTVHNFTVCFCYNCFVIYSQNIIVRDSFLTTGIRRQNNVSMTSDVNYIDMVLVS